MKSRMTLKELFESKKELLSERLSQYSLPKDTKTVQAIVKDYLDELFDSDGDFRQSLTQSEDYILQSALGLLNAQQSIIGEYTKFGSDCEVRGHQFKETNSERKAMSPNQYPMVIGGTTLGGAAGALLLGSWGAVFGAIAGTAVVLYCVTQTGQPEKAKRPTPIPDNQAKDGKLNVNTFLSIIGNICTSVDDLINTVRTQIQRIKTSYENQENPTLLGTYTVLASNLEQLFTTSLEEDATMDDIKMQIEMVKRSLKNYGVVYENGKLTNK